MRVPNGKRREDGGATIASACPLTSADVDQPGSRDTSRRLPHKRAEKMLAVRPLPVIKQHMPEEDAQRTHWLRDGSCPGISRRFQNRRRMPLVLASAPAAGVAVSLCDSAITQGELGVAAKGIETKWQQPMRLKQSQTMTESERNQLST